MTCSSCTHAVEAALLELSGVNSAVISLVQQEARVEYSPGSICKVALNPIPLNACHCDVDAIAPICTMNML